MSAELAALLTAHLRVGPKQAEKVLQAFEEELLLLRGLYLDGDVQRTGAKTADIVGMLTRADGSNLSERDVKIVAAWLDANPAVAEFSMGPLNAADSPEFRSGGDQ